MILSYNPPIDTHWVLPSLDADTMQVHQNTKKQRNESFQLHDGITHSIDLLFEFGDFIKIPIY